MAEVVMKIRGLSCGGYMRGAVAVCKPPGGGSVNERMTCRPGGNLSIWGTMKGGRGSGAGAMGGGGAEGAFEGVEEAGAVGAREALAAALAERIGGAKIGHQVAGGQDVADIGLGQWLAVMLEHQRPGGHASGGKGDVAGDDHIARSGTVGDPLVGHVGAFGHDDRFDQRILRGAQAAVRDDEHLHLVAGADLFDLGLHGAGIGVDIDAHGEGAAVVSPGRAAGASGGSRRTLYSSGMGMRLNASRPAIL